jgi:hypothetical protein
MEFIRIRTVFVNFLTVPILSTVQLKYWSLDVIVKVKVKPVIVAGDHTKFPGGKLNKSLTLPTVFLKINHSSLTSLRHKHVPVFSPQT